MSGFDIKKRRKELGLTQGELAEKLGVDRRTIINYEKGESIPASKVKLLDIILSESENSTSALLVNDPFELEFSQNKNANDFMKLENGQYLMTMPLAEFNIQAGLLDHYQDVDFMQGLTKHSIIVDNPVKGRYLAFRVKGDSMDDDSKNAIPQNYIVATRELHRQHWTSPLRFKSFPFWVIYTSQASYPLLKQIIAHDTTKGMITCHSLNDSPEYTDFDLSLDEVQALFYVINIHRDVAPDNY